VKHSFPPFNYAPLVIHSIPTYLRLEYEGLVRRVGIFFPSIFFWEKMGRKKVCRIRYTD
jgi:hypothetical protein